MSTSSSDPRDQSDTPRSNTDDAGHAYDGPEPAGTDAPPSSDRVPDSQAPAGSGTYGPDAETTAVRRQGFLGRRDDADTTTVAGTGAAAGVGDDAAGNQRSAATRASWAATPDRVDDGAARQERWRDSPEPPTEVLLEGATQTAPRSRAGSHALALILSIILVPIAWYLVADAGARLTLGESSPWETGDVNVAAVIELVAGLVVVAAILLLARWSSLGATVVGTVVLLAGLAFVVVPGVTREFVEPAVEWLSNFNDLGRNVAHHLTEDGPAGRLALYGLALLLAGIVSHGARRLGRTEERARDAYARRQSRAATTGRG